MAYEQPTFGGGAPRPPAVTGTARPQRGAIDAEHEQAIFAALADPTRRAVLRAVATGEGDTATDIAATLPISRQAVAKHLAQLERAQLVGARRAGRETRFEATPAPLTDAIAWMTEVGSQWDARLAALGDTVRRR